LKNIIYFFLKHGGTATCVVANNKYYYSQVAGGLEIHWFYKICGKYLHVTYRERMSGVQNDK